MIKVYDFETCGWEKAIHGMRNPKNSWSRSDSEWKMLEGASTKSPKDYRFSIGENDMKLAKALVKAGSEHRKFVRFIHVQCECLAPLYWWKEWDTYKIGTTANSTSTMHKLGSRPLTEEDFAWDKVAPINSEILNYLNRRIEKLSNSEHRESEEAWRAMIQILPESYLQLRTLDFNYEVALNVYKQRRNHKLSEWNTFCDSLLSLPYFREFIGETNG